VLNVPTTIIVGAVHRPPVARAPRQPYISAMHCADWRVLDMGSGGVQVCE
jgi:hypothetical protein